MFFWRHNTEVVDFTISHDALQIIKFFESCHLMPYHDVAGFSTIGWGHLLSPVKWKPHPTNLVNGITQKQADNLLAQDVNIAVKGLQRFIDSNIQRKLKQQHIDALGIFVFNVGIGNFKSSTLRTNLNNDDLDGVIEEFPKWRRAGGVVYNGLVKRRACTAHIFDKGVYNTDTWLTHKQYIY